MRASIEPVSVVPPALVRDHLLRYGLQDAIIEWKYFDPAFRPVGERGYVWMTQGRVQGMIGLIPFRLAGAPTTVQTAWTCDWFVESSVRNPGIGILVLKEAIARTGLLFTIGGNEATAKLIPRMATHTEPGAAVEMALPLTVGGMSAYRRLARRLPVLAAVRLESIPLRRSWGNRLSQRFTVRLCPGIDSALACLIEQGGASGWVPAYDAAHMAWQFERCPVIEAASVVAVDGGTPLAGALCWRRRDDPRSWRLALWVSDDEQLAAQAVVKEAVQEIHRRRGHRISTMVARIDSVAAAVLGAAGFQKTDWTLPLYVLAKESHASLSSLNRLGFVDGDLSYRF